MNDPRSRDQATTPFDYPAAAPSQASTDSQPDSQTSTESASSPTGGIPHIGGSLGRFAIRKLLGSGSFGAVFQAFDPQLDREVALKLPRAGTILTDDDAHRFMREARAAAQLRHPNIVPIFDAGKAGNTHYIASGLVVGQTLKDLLKAKQRFAPRAAAELVAKLADALAYAHSVPIVHRDIKPANILVDEQGEPHLADFGLARRFAGEALRTQEGARLGTPAYMSPEQISGQSHTADGRSDQWSLGVVLYELLTGVRPFRGELAQLEPAIRTSDPRPPSALARGVPRDLDTVCWKCLAKEREHRYADCGALADDLRRWLRDEPVRARRVFWPERLYRWSRRNPATSGLVAAVTLATLAALVIVAVSAVLLSNSNKKLGRALTQSNVDRTRAEASDRKSREQLSQARLQTALAQAQKGDPHSALPLLGDVWRLTADVPSAEPVHRRRLGAFLRASPRLRYEWFGLHDSTLSPTGKYVVIRRAERVEVWRTSDMQVVWKFDNPGASPQIALAFSFSPDDSRLVIAEPLRETQILDPATGEVLAMLGERTQPAQRLAFSDDGRRLVACMGERQGHLGLGLRAEELRVWNAADGKPLGKALEGPDFVPVSLGFVGQGEVFAHWRSQVKHEYAIWNYLQGTQLQRADLKNLRAEDQPLSAIVDAAGNLRDLSRLQPIFTQMSQANPIENPSGAFSSDGNWFVATFGQAQRVEVWHSQGGQALTLDTPPSVTPWKAAFCGSSRYLAMYGGLGPALVWDLQQRRQVAGLGHGGLSVNVVQSSASGQLLLTHDYLQKSSRLWQQHAPATQRLPEMPIVTSETPDDHPRVVYDPRRQVAFVSFTGSRAQFGESQPNRLIDVRSGRDIATFTGSMFWQPDWPEPVVVDGAGGESVWQPIDLATGKPRGAGCRHYLGFVAGVSADGSRIATWSPGYTGTNRPPGAIVPEGFREAFAVLWNAATGEVVHEFQPVAGELPWTRVCLTPDGQRVLLITNGGPPLLADRKRPRLEVWDAAKRDWLYPAKEFDSNISTPAMSADGKLVAVFDNARRLGAMSIATGAWQLPPVQLSDFFTMVQFDPQAARLAAATSSQLLLLPLAGGSPRRMPLSHKVDLAAFSADGQWLAVAGGKVAQVWSAERGEAISPPLWHDTFVSHVVFDDDGDTLVTCAADGTICRWDLRPETRPRAELEAEAQLLSARQVAPDGALLPLSSDEIQALQRKLLGQRLAPLAPYTAPPPLAPPMPAAPPAQPTRSVTTTPRGAQRVSSDELGRAFQLRYVKTASGDFHAGDLVPLFTMLEYPRSEKRSLIASDSAGPIGRVRFLVERLGDDSRIKPLESMRAERIGKAYALRTAAITGGTNYLTPGQQHINMWPMHTSDYPPGKYRVTVEWISASDAVFSAQSLEVDLLPLSNP